MRPEFCSTTTARSFLDPGTGSMIWQMLAATVVGCAFYFTKMVRKLRTGGASMNNFDAAPSELPGLDQYLLGAALVFCK